MWVFLADHELPPLCFTIRGLGEEGRRALCKLNTDSAVLLSPANIRQINFIY